MKSRWLLAIFGLLAALTAKGETIYSGQSLYQNIYIRDTGDLRCMQFQAENTIIKHYQGCVYRNSKKMAFGYSEAFMAALFMKAEPSRVLVIGLGAGVVPRNIRETVPSALIEVVEIDAEVVRLARQYFAWFEDDQRMRTYVADGRLFVKGAAEQGIKYDIVLLDAFTSEYVPEHMMTLDFLEEVKAILKPGGVVAANTFARSQLYDHESMTYQTAYGDFFNVQLEGKSSNRVILAGGFGKPDVEMIRQNALGYAKHFWQAYELNVNDLLTNMENEKDWDQDARVLTDQYSPANILAGRDRLKGSWRNSFAFGLEQLVDEQPLAAAIGLLALIMAFLYAIMKLFDWVVLLRRNPITEITE